MLPRSSQPVYGDHSVRQLLAQRLYGLALGYEDLNDHERLRLIRFWPPPARSGILGQDRFNPAHRGVALAGASTLNRLELSNNKNTRGHKLSHDPSRIEAVLLQWACAVCPNTPRRSWWTWTRWGIGCMGCRKGRHYRAYYDEYCYLPLYVFVGDFPLWAQLRTSDKDGADGVVAALEKIVAAIRQRCRRARFLVRGDCGFGREEIMAWCESHDVYYCLGLGKNSVLTERLRPALANAQARWCLSGAAAREFAEFEYRTAVGAGPAASLARPK